MSKRIKEICIVSHNITKYYKMSKFHNVVEQIMIENTTLSKTRMRRQNNIYPLT